MPLNTKNSLYGRHEALIRPFQNHRQMLHNFIITTVNNEYSFVLFSLPLIAWCLTLYFKCPSLYLYSYCHGVWSYIMEYRGQLPLAATHTVMYRHYNSFKIKKVLKHAWSSVVLPNRQQTKHKRRQHKTRQNKSFILWYHLYFKRL